MKLSKVIKRLFPIPRIPQKRYLAALGLALYYIAKLYVGSTGSSIDDQIPDMIKDVFSKLTL